MMFCASSNYHVISTGNVPLNLGAKVTVQRRIQYHYCNLIYLLSTTQFVWSWLRAGACNVFCHKCFVIQPFQPPDLLYSYKVTVPKFQKHTLTAHVILCELFLFQGYPTFWYFVGAQKKFKYHGQYTKKAFFNFFNK